MKIIEHGDTIKENCCDNCGCIFQYSKQDIKTKRIPAYPFSDYPLDYDIIDFVECPECGFRFILSSEQEKFVQISEEERSLKQKQSILEKEKKRNCGKNKTFPERW